MKVRVPVRGRAPGQIVNTGGAVAAGGQGRVKTK